MQSRFPFFCLIVSLRVLHLLNLTLLLALWPQVESVWEQTLLDVMVPVGIIVLACVPTDTTRHGGFKIMVSAGHRALKKSARHDVEGWGRHSVWVHFQFPMLVAHTELCTMPSWLGHQAYVHSVASGVVFVVAPIVLLIKCIPRRRSATILGCTASDHAMQSL